MKKELKSMDILKKHQILRSLFEQLTADVLEDMFVAEFSPVGSNDLAK